MKKGQSMRRDLSVLQVGNFFTPNRDQKILKMISTSNKIREFLKRPMQLKRQVKENGIKQSIFLLQSQKSKLNIIKMKNIQKNRSKPKLSYNKLKEN